MAPPGSSARALRAEALAALTGACDFYASLATRGGYAGAHSLDLRRRYGESRSRTLSDTAIWVQPPGTPSVGGAFLEAYGVTGRERDLAAAVEAGLALAWGQRVSGGWDYVVDVGHLERGATRVLRKQGRCVLDDNTSQGAVSFLIDLDGAVDRDWLTESVGLGLSYLVESQFPNGAWPQVYPLRGGYHDYYTFNDGVINRCIETLLKAHRTYGNERYLRAAVRGGEFMLRSQGQPPQAGWAQQYSHDLAPAWGRDFEPPGYCSVVTARNLATLLRLHRRTGEDRFLAPVEAAVGWLERSRIGSNTWARIYEPGSNRPVYGDRENRGKVIYDYEKLSRAERRAYSWRGEMGIADRIEKARCALARGGLAGEAADPKPPPEPDVVREVIASLDERGRWVRGGRVYSRDFVRGAGQLCRFLSAEAAR